MVALLKSLFSRSRRPRFSWDWFQNQRFGRLSFIPELLRLFSRSDQAAETLLYQKISDLRIETELTPSELKWLQRLKELAELRAMAFGRPMRDRRRLRQAFVLKIDGRAESEDTTLFFEGQDISVQDITESAIVVADLYWKLLETCEGKTFPDLAGLARGLAEEIFGHRYDSRATQALVERITDTMQRERGVPFLALNLLVKGDFASARALTGQLLSDETEMDEEVRSSLYWVSELSWFVREGAGPIQDFESTVRYLYHLCFTNADRAGFLEIDSQFYSEFGTVSEIAREGFLFKETLFEKILELWSVYDGYFDGVFRGVLESMSQRRSKIYDERESWERFWKREKGVYSREYLYVVEGNLCYASGHFEDACDYYEKALELSPKLRSALLNSLFAYARLHRWKEHERTVQTILKESSFLPSCLAVIGNSYLLLGDESRADRYYEELKGIKGWEKKTDYYKSTFCFENGLLDQALKFAERAYLSNPNDASVAYHLSVCYNASGEKGRALEMLEKMTDSPDLQWLNYYRFTLERDAGRLEAATETLRRIPVDYFQDPDELAAAQEFARSRQDLGLLRRLRARNKT